MVGRDPTIVERTKFWELSNFTQLISCDNNLTMTPRQSFLLLGKASTLISPGLTRHHERGCGWCAAPGRIIVKGPMFKIKMENYALFFLIVALNLKGISIAYVNLDFNYRRIDLSRPV